MTDYGSKEWTQASKSTPCPVCEKTDYCSQSPDSEVVYCMRIESDRAKESGAGLGWLHFLTDDNEQPKNFIPRAAKVKPSPKIDWDKRVTAMFTCKQSERTRKQLSIALGVSVESLEKLRIGYGTMNGSPYSSWPERLPSGKYCGVVTRFQRDGAKRMVKHSKHGLYYCDGWDEGNKAILLPEGGSDTAALITLGVSAIGRFSATGGTALLAAMLAKTKRRVIVLGERDFKEGACEQPHCCPMCRPGEFGARTVAKRLATAIDPKKKGRVIWAFPAEGFKDVRDWLQRKGGTAGQLFKSMEYKQ